jgi:glucose/arabinose dehydrogenase
MAERGLLSMAFHPNYATNGFFYVDYTAPGGALTVARYHVSTDPNVADPATAQVLLSIPHSANSNHNGGLVTFGPDGYLYIGLGDGGPGNDPMNYGQNTATLLGKMLRIDVNTRSTAPRARGRRAPLEYGIPADNPFVSEPEMNGQGARKEIYAYGLREPWRFSFDRQTGELWAGDVGQELWEEINLIVKGGNYGWCVVEGAHHFKPGPPGAQYIAPVIEYPHRNDLLAESKFPRHGIGVCVVGGYVYRGKKYPSLEGVYIYADNVPGTIWGLRCRDGKVTDYGTLLAQPKNIVSFAEDADGEIYALAFDTQEAGTGRIYALETE